MHTKELKTRFAILAIMVIIALPSCAQRTFIYAHAKTISKAHNTYRLVLDIGQASTPSFVYDYLVDDNNKPVVFNSQIDALNLLGKQGWEVITCGADSAGLVRNFYLKKETTGMKNEEVKAFLGQYRMWNMDDSKSREDEDK